MKKKTIANYNSRKENDDDKEEAGEGIKIEKKR